MAAPSPEATARAALGAFGAGLLGAAAFPPVGFFPLALVAPCVLLVLLRNRNAAAAGLLGFLYGLAQALGTMYWFFNIFGLLTILLLLLSAAYWGLLGLLIGMTRDRSPLARAALVALFAVGLEWLRGDAWYLRFPWYTAPHALAAWPSWIASARWVGTYGLSLLIWFVTAWGTFGPRTVWAAFLLLPACWWLLPSPGVPRHRALLVQAERRGELDHVLHGLSEEDVELVVLPELAYHDSPESLLRQQDGPGALARKLKAPVVFGARRGRENLAAVIDARGELLGTFTKQRPVPLFAGDGVPGTRRPVFEVGPGHILGVAVCYDFDAPEVVATLAGQGATVLVAPTLDAMSWGRVQHIEHEMLARLRAVENDRWVLRAASSGRSEAVAPNGVPSAEGIDLGDCGVITVAFEYRSRFALGGQLYFLGPGAAAGTALVVLLFGVEYYRGRHQRKEATFASSSEATPPNPAGKT